MPQNPEVKLAELRLTVDMLEAKIDELFMRPRMPYTQNALTGDVLELDGNLQPQWVTPA